MPEYIANGVLWHKGNVLHEGASLTLTEEEASYLGDKVIPVEVAKPEKPFDEMTIKELKPLAKKAGIKAYTTLKHAELVESLEDLQPVNEAVTEDEPGND